MCRSDATMLASGQEICASADLVHNHPKERAPAANAADFPARAWSHHRKRATTVSPETPLARLLRGCADEKTRATLAEAFSDGVFHPAAAHSGLAAHEQHRLTYRRLAALLAKLPPGRELLADSSQFFAVIEYTAVVDPSLAMAFTIHCGLALGALLELGEGRDDLAEHIQSLESCDTFGVFAVTELGYGNSHLAPTTEAHFDPVSREFVLHTPDLAAQKFMTNTGIADLPKTAIVMARLLIDNEDHGTGQFVVQLCDEDGPRPGITMELLPATPVVTFDYGLLRFERLRLPYEAWLRDGASIDTDGRLHDWVPTPEVRLARSLAPARNVWGGLPSALAAVSRASVLGALQFSQGRVTTAQGDSARRPLLDYSAQQRALLVALGKSFAMTCATNHSRRPRTPTMNHLREAAAAFAARPGAMAWSPWAALDREAGVIKAMAAWSAAEVSGECRRRCGASGILSVNSFLSHELLAYAFNHAGGDNNLIILEAARTMAEGLDYTPPDPAPQAAHHAHLDSPERWLALVQGRETRLAARLAAAAAHPAGTPVYQVWNPLQDLARELGEAYGTRRITEITLAAVESLPQGAGRRRVTALTALYVLDHVSTHSGPYICENLLTTAEAAQIPDLIARQCAGLLPQLPDIYAEFGFPSGLLHAPVFGTDYADALSFASSRTAAFLDR
ncbi:hypothetical protein ACIPJK_37485 [Streptomyces roseus]|uniref:acyl-CoA dehydrogenase family protein n=1 Tax=Streptomyces roseus TaxID=66430 RepID=UPI003830FB37